MPRALFVYVTIVAAFPAALAAAPPISDDVPVPAEVVAVARTIGLDPPHDRARFASEMARLLYTPAGKTPALALLLNQKLIDPALVAAEAPLHVPVPLTADAWSRIIKRPVRADQLFATIMIDRRAALLCYALAALDDETLAYIAQHPELLNRVYERDAAIFGAFGASLRIHDGRVVPPGGSAAAPLWESVVKESTAVPDAFVRMLFNANQGHLAYLYDTIAQLDQPHAAFALGSWMADPAARIARFNALLDVSTRSYREWRLETLPFSKPLHDLSMLLLRLHVEADGVMSPPGTRAFWAAVFGGDDLRADAGMISHEPLAQLPVDAAWLAETTSGSDMFWRGDRLEQVAFGQRVFAGIAPKLWPDAVVAIRAFPRQRALLMTLERMGIREPAVYSAIARDASRVSGGSPNRAFWTLAQLESLAALVARMTISGTLSQDAGQRLMVSIFSVPTDGDRYDGRVAAWLERELLPLLPAGDDVEERIIAGVAGAPAGAKAPRVFWEGQQYRLDLAAGERKRIHAIRIKQEGYSVDVAMTLATIAKTLSSDPVTVETLRSMADALAALPAKFTRRLEFSPESRPPGIDEPRPAKEWLEKVIDESAKAARNSDLKRASRIAAMINDRIDDMLGDALLSIAYAADLGDPDGPAMLARNVALRHDFGFGRKDSEVRTRTIWSMPRQDFLPGVPWHVTGSVVGLDIAMAGMALKRITPDRIADAPKLPSNEREGYSINVSLMNPRALTDADRDAITSAIDRGGQRVAALMAGRETLETIADALVMDGWRRRAIAWMLTEDRQSIPTMFSLVELLTLGGGAANGNVDAWGAAAVQLDACMCSRLTMPRYWRLLSGRPQMAFLAASIPDLHLFIAMKLHELELPAGLARTILQAAVLDFVEEVGPTDPNDWWTIVRRARTIPQNLVEDYVAAAAAVDGPLIPDETDSTREH